jgi:hypothetical protein
MHHEVERTCEQHRDRFECPDCLVAIRADGSFGLIIHDGGSSSIRIWFCPWCGATLPTTSDD